jgi:1-acyl-sn-glycerol-3-phosphate acyltransferase
VNARALLRIAGLLGLFAVLGTIHVLTKRAFGRSFWPRRFLRASGWILGARVRVQGAYPKPHTLFIANHTSWLDILVLGGATGCAFVSKDELGHRLIHWLADQNGTVYVRRSHRKGAKDQAVALAKALERSQPVVIFPEGTTGPGTHLLPFRSTLLEAANFAARNVQIRPVAVDYHENRHVVGWYHESGKANVLKILRRAGTLRVTVHLLPPLKHASNRKELTHGAREAIATKLGLTLHGHSPIDGPE